jgi:acetyl esterase/lipase
MKRDIAMNPNAPDGDYTMLIDPGLRMAAPDVGATTIDFERLWRKGRPPAPPEDSLPLHPDIAEISIPGPGGAPPLPLLVMNAGARGAPRPIVLFLHGGGYIGGSVRREAPRMQEVARVHDCIVICLDYRLAPEAPFPAARDDSYAALAWIHANAEVLGGDAARIVVFGESAGAGLAAQLTLVARDRGEFPIRAQILVYPMIDDRAGSSRIPAPHIGSFIWTGASNRFGWKCYLGTEPGGDDISPEAAPARATDLAGLPPAWIGVGGLDLFVDESIAYAQRLIAAGVPTGLLVLPGAYHGFNRRAPDAPISRAFNAAWNEALTGYFATGG